MVKPDDTPLPPEGLWISPEGEPIPVIEHLLEIHHNPEKFGLAPKDVRGLSIENLRKVAVELIGKGWTRFRFLSGTWNFEVDSVKVRLSTIEDVLVRQMAYPQERVVVSQAAPKRDFQGTVAEFYDRSMFRHYELGRANTWRVT